MSNNNTLDKTNTSVKLAAYAIYLVSFLWLWKKARKAIYDFRLKQAKMKADRLRDKINRNVFVYQIENRFIIGVREEMRRSNSRGRKLVKQLSGHNVFDFDYRRALVYTAKR
ncbi:MAG: hypothetical protein LBR64_02250 [Dysgonamonadaceae bacterium]|jgi:hypothetical protein|nr:hypothetical protein [Dysgonamonadaceae bacterium]